MNSISIIGSGGHARVIIDLARLNEIKIHALFDDDLQKNNLKFCDIPITVPIDINITGLSVVAIGQNRIRKKIVEKVSNADWFTLIHPSAIISKDVTIGEGSVIMAGSIIQAGTKIGKHCIINTGAIIDHDCIIEDFVHIAPQCGIAGSVRIGYGAFVGLGTSIIPNKIIGQWVTVGAGSVVISDQPDYCVTFGLPAKPIKYNYEQA